MLAARSTRQGFISQLLRRDRGRTVEEATERQERELV